MAKWTTYIVELSRGHIHLIHRVDELIWPFNPSSGDYSTKLGYFLEFVDGDGTCVVWWNFFWKSKAPPKFLLFMWLVTNNKVLT